MLGDKESYAGRQEEARTVRLLGHASLMAPSAALKPGEAAGWSVEHGESRRAGRDGSVLVVFGAPSPAIEGWQAATDARPPIRVLMSVPISETESGKGSFSRAINRLPRFPDASSPNLQLDGLGRNGPVSGSAPSTPEDLRNDAARVWCLV